MFVNIVQKWNEFKQNWAEYQKLRRVVARAWHKLDRMQAKITVVYRESDPRPQKHCIASKILEVPQMDTIDDFLSGKRPVVMTVNKYCPHFRGDTTPVQPCNDNTCPHHAENCAYVAAAQEYETAKTQKRTFWGRVRNKTK